MKNILNETPDQELFGRSLYTFKFLDKNDIDNKNILDVGCGFGWFEYHLLKNKYKPKKVVGIDITSKDVLTAKDFIKHENFYFKEASIFDLALKDKFDTVVSFEVIEHIPKNTEIEMFEKVNKLLRNKGVFYLSTPYNNFFSKLFDPAYFLIGHRHYSLDQLKNFAKKTGFKVEKFAIKGGFFDLISNLNMYIAKWIFRREKFFKSFFHKKQNYEFLEKEKGINTIFVKFRKIKNI